MKRNILSLLAAAALVVSASAGVLAPSVRVGHAGGVRSMAAPVKESPYVPVIIEVEDEAAVDELRRRGVVVYGSRGGLVLSSVPQGILGDVEDIAGVVHVSSSLGLSANMELARPYTRVDEVQVPAEGTGLSGRGVTVGFCDVGFDPSHPAFAGRVAAIADFDASQAASYRAVTPAEMNEWTTDDTDQWHASHVGGILCGSPSDAPQYRGVATGAALVATTSRLSDVGILAGLEEIITRAREAGQPAVVNMSLSSAIGPHDGSSAMCRYLDMCADDAVIVLSAGNSGRNPVSLSHRFTSERPTAATMLYPQSGNGLEYHLGYVDAWSADSRPIGFRVCIYDREAGGFMAASDWIDPAAADSDEAVVALGDLTAVMDGDVSVAWETAPHNGRFNLLLAVGSSCKIPLSGTKDKPRYLVAVDFRGAQATEMDAFTNGTYSFYRLPTSAGADVGPDMSISDLATARRVLSVGSLTTRNHVTLIDGTDDYWPSVGDGTVSSYTSYGRLRDGRSLPMVSAPGAIVISATNSHYLAEHPEAVAETCYRDASGAYYAPNSGTSMSSPLVAGVCALWLEAAPWLTTDDVRRIACASADISKADAADMRSGAGCIDAVAGLRMIRDEAGIAGVEAGGVTLRRVGTTLVATDMYGDPVDVEVYDLAGRRISCDNVPSGPVIVRYRCEGVPAARLVP